MATVASDDSKPSPPVTVTPSAPPAPDPERPPAAGGDAVTSVVRLWQREDLLLRGMTLLRAMACVFSLISLLVMASNKHGDWRDFDKYEEYRYCLAIAILAWLYTMAQILRQVHRFSTGKDLVSKQASAIVDFAGDQVIAYLLISASSVAIPITNRMREGADNMFTDASSTSISMAFFAFIALALSALISLILRDGVVDGVDDVVVIKPFLLLGKVLLCGVVPPAGEPWWSTESLTLENQSGDQARPRADPVVPWLQHTG